MEKDDFVRRLSTTSNISSTTDEILQDGTKVRTLETTAATIRFCFIDDTSTDSEDDTDRDSNVDQAEVIGLDEKDDKSDNEDSQISEESSTACDLSTPSLSPTSVNNTYSKLKDTDSPHSEDNTIEAFEIKRQRSIIDEDQIDALISTTQNLYTNTNTTTSPTSEYHSGSDSPTVQRIMELNDDTDHHNNQRDSNNGGARPKNISVSSQSSQRSADSVTSQRSSIDRFNPFNKDIEIDEDYYSNDGPSHNTPQPKLRTITNRTHSTSSSSATDDLIVSVDEDEFVFAHLGLDEDYFSQPEGHFGLSTSEELEMAIDHCKDLINKTGDRVERKKALVQKLVQLRLKLQEAKEGPQETAADTKVVLGHHFQRQESRTAKHYCEKCVTVIWGMLQIWYKCRDCDYSCHCKCLGTMTRMCALAKIQESPQYVLSIRPERGLAAQQYRCSECRAVISFKSGEEPRQCDYNGNYYCSLCHWNDTSVIPARVLHNWDFTPVKVCRASKQFLHLMKTRPSLCLQTTNPMLFSFVEELSEIKRLRQEILMMKQYFLSCQDALTSKLLLQLNHRQHFVDGCDMYSLQDLLDIETESLLPDLCKIHTTFAQHIKTDCERCHAKGHICEICNVHEALFPFDNHVFVCQECQAVLHKHCFRKKEGICPRCKRKNVKTKP